MRKVTAANMFIAIVMFSLIYANYQYYVVPSRFLQSVGAAQQTREGDAVRIAELYTFHIELNEHSPGSAYIYLPRYETVDEAMAFRLFSAFGITDNPQSIIETSDMYFASNSDALMTIYKFERTVSYMRFFDPNTTDLTPIDTARAVETAHEFTQARGLFVPHDELETHSDGTGFDITFVSRLSGLKNYGFSSSLRIDRFGRILGFTYSDITFDRLSSHKVMPMKDASHLLPADIDGHIHITSAELVYTFENSIIQPAYLFRGTCQHGREFRSYVLAARF